MRVVILAAGVGSRLMPLTRNTPKSLLDLGNGFTLLESQLAAIGEAGVEAVTLVTGYKSEQIEAKIKDYHDFDFTIRFNPFYRTANNAVSAWMGLDNLTEPTVLVNGDDLFGANVIADLIVSDEPIAMVISRSDEYDAEDMKVITKDDAVTDVGKDIPVSDANGESIGMILFQGVGLAHMQDQLERLVRVESDLGLFYLEALRRMMRQGHRIAFVECDEGDWAEVDFHPDLDEMRSQVLSRLSW